MWRDDQPRDGASLSCWFMTTGQAGFRSQARGLAQALAEHPREFVTGLKSPWNLLPAALTPSPLALIDPTLDTIEPPWPDLVISCGRRVAAIASAVRRASRGRTLAVHVQDPLAPPRGFDLIVAMAHDPVSAPNVIKVSTALHPITGACLDEAAIAWAERLRSGPRPLAGVLVGGPKEGFDFPAGAFVTALRRLRAEGTGLAIVASRRTPREIMTVVGGAFAGDPDVFVWDGEGDNPYLGVLALSDRIVVTTDSVSMISEALATPHPVEVFGEAQSGRHARFLNRLLDDGLIARFTGAPASPRRAGPVDATAIAAQAVRRLLASRTGVSG